jgi:ABC-2 type transport system ATP-binding protein
MGDLAIEITDLHKAFRRQTALNGLNLRVPRGSIFGLLGRNGAGKTTTIRALMGQLRCDAGEIVVLGERIAPPRDAVAIRRRIGFVTEDKDLYPYMTVDQVIRFTRSLFPTWRRDREEHLCTIFELPRERRIPDLSKGMRSKLMLLLAVAHDADLLVLDEPTEGLDPVGMDDVMREIISLAAQNGTTVFFSSHHLDQVDQICDHVAIVDRGQCRVAAAIDELKARYKRIRVVFAQKPQDTISWVDGVESVQYDGRTASILAARNSGALAEQARSIAGSRVEVHDMSLREIFLEHARGD